MKNKRNRPISAKTIRWLESRPRPRKTTAFFGSRHNRHRDAIAEWLNSIPVTRSLVVVFVKEKPKKRKAK